MRSITGIFAFALTVVASASYAIDNGVDPETGSTINPDTKASSELWKLAGSVSGSSAVQIAPRWILASRHATPVAGDVFTNKYGQATVQQACEPAPGAYEQTKENDLSLCRLSSPITLPSSASFPPLSAVADADLQHPEYFDHWGDLLTVGTSGGSRRIAWTHLSGVPNGFDPYDYSVGPTGIQANVSPRIPVGANGDSGGAAFLYPYDSPSAALVGVLTSAADMGNAPTYLTRANVNWISAYIGGFGDVMPATVAIEQLVGDATARLPRLMPDNSVTAAVTGDTTAALTWATPPADPANGTAITRYMIRLQGQGDASARFVTKPQAGTLSLSSLTAGKRYQGCVLSGNSLGYGQNVHMALTSTAQTIYRPGCASFVAGKPNPVSISDWDAPKNASSGKTDFWANWTPNPNGTTVYQYLVTIRVWTTSSSHITGQPATRTLVGQTSFQNFQISDVISGKELACWSVKVKSSSMVQSDATTEQCFAAAP